MGTVKDWREICRHSQIVLEHDTTGTLYELGSNAVKQGVTCLSFLEGVRMGVDLAYLKPLCDA